MKPITREEIEGLYKQGWSKQDAKAHLKREAAREALELVRSKYTLYGQLDNEEMFNIVGYILGNMVVQS